MSNITCREEIEVYYVELRNRVTNEIIRDVYCGQDYEHALKEKDQYDLTSGTTQYTIITTDFLSEDMI